MKKMLLLLLSAGAALTMMADLLPSASLCQLLRERGQTLDILLLNSSSHVSFVLEITCNEFATMDSQNHSDDNNSVSGICNTHQAPRREQSTTNVSLSRDGNNVVPDITGHGGSVHSQIDPRPTKPGNNTKPGILSMRPVCLDSLLVSDDLVNDKCVGSEEQGQAAVDVVPVSQLGASDTTDGPTAAVVTGDVSCDGIIAINDVTGLIDILLGGGELPAWADVDGNGEVTIADVTTLVDMLLKKK